MRIYIAGPMTGLPQFNYPAFNRAAETLRDAGHIVFNPAENFDGDSTRTRAEYLREDMRMLLLCEGIALLPGWRESLGARHEVLAAQLLGLRIFAYTVRNLIDIGDGFPKVRMILGDAL